MKKAVVLITILSVLFSSIIGVAADSNLKDIEVILSDTPAVVNIGEVVELTATVPKHGSTYDDTWDNAVQSVTYYDSLTGTYISKAVFKAEKSGIYNISYTVKMTSGGSDTVFYRKVERTIEVVNPITVIGAAVKNLNIIPVYGTAGEIAYYRTCGQVYALWSDNSETPVDSSVFFFFGPNETSKEVNVSFTIEDKQYNYMVTINR